MTPFIVRLRLNFGKNNIISWTVTIIRRGIYKKAHNHLFKDVRYCFAKCKLTILKSMRQFKLSQQLFFAWERAHQDDSNYTQQWVRSELNSSHKNLSRFILIHSKAKLTCNSNSLLVLGSHWNPLVKPWPDLLVIEYGMNHRLEST